MENAKTKKIKINGVGYRVAAQLKINNKIFNMTSILSTSKAYSLFFLFFKGLQYLENLD